jgi:hypothetical protein
MLTPLQSFLIIGSILSLFILPLFIYLKISSKKNKQKQETAFEGLIEKYQIKLTERETFNFWFIGFDEAMNALLFYNTQTKEEEFVSLSQVTDCIVKESKSEGWVNDVCLVFKNKNGSNSRIYFYKRFQDFSSVQQSVDKANYWRDRTVNKI